ncbi:MAG: hypothetical protein COU31_01700 [Candidatus Magasanikbacteria bacterium CG10_big_fil_rev_8_21_14_0_10_40_10]|uniref:Dipeptidylpeptidase IV N-terminal domain-containing protein n=1 Tax=Candidatus Magasanikbacteria bacterium CG10_big_fil_rev_8_21_14_0_10_40_10 TaxID=1974648 RepID=A0A2M6W4D6_9BACT|nr:MAG: hypothetical protein COU31_01700 [Candidatus Magasanikbacteria bacterium CG10_big_fil_rev_8_21_14_0_10_40_10]
MFDKKRIALIIGLIILVVAIAYAIYHVFFRPASVFFPPSTTPIATTTGALPSAQQRLASSTGQVAVTPGSLPTAANVQTDVPASYYTQAPVTKLTSDYSIYTSVNSNNGAVRYHDALDGKFYRIDANGQIKEMADQVFYNVNEVTWAKSADKAVIEYPDKTKILYNFETNKQISIPKHWEDFSFSSDAKEVAAKSIGIAPSNRLLISFNDDGTGIKTIEPMGNNADAVTVDWSPSRQVVAFSQTGDAIGAEREEILLVGLNGENFKSLTVEGRGFESQWSPTGKRIIYSVYSSRSSYKPELWISDAYGDNINSNRNMVNVNTWPDKCAFASDDAIYCAVPNSLPDGAGMNKTSADSAVDSLYKIDLTTGLKTPLPLDSNYTINSISYDAKNQKLYFTDANQNGIFEVNL